MTGEVVGALLLGASWVLIPVGFTARSRQTNDGGADTFLCTALIAMGLFSSLFVFMLLRDVALLIAALFTSAVATAEVQEASASIVVGAAVFVTLLGFINAGRVARVVHVDVPMRDRRRHRNQSMGDSFSTTPDPIRGTCFRSL